MKKLIVIIGCLIFFFILPSLVMAQASGPADPGGGPIGSDPPLGGGAPIGEGIVVLLGLGLVYGARKIYKVSEELED